MSNLLWGGQYGGKGRQVDDYLGSQGELSHLPGGKVGGHAVLRDPMVDHQRFKRSVATLGVPGSKRMVVNKDKRCQGRTQLSPFRTNLFLRGPFPPQLERVPRRQDGREVSTTSKQVWLPETLSQPWSQSLGVDNKSQTLISSEFLPIVGDRFGYVFPDTGL